MRELDTHLRRWLVWLAPFVVLALLIGWETEWGSALRHTASPETAATPLPVSVALLPEFKLDGGPDPRHDAVDRTLFNPTRRPAPPMAATAAAGAQRPGQFTLTGTSVVDGKSTAFLREVAGGRSRRVVEGDTINGMVVAEVKSDRVRFAVGDQSEELTLKIAAGPKTTIQPASPAVPTSVPAAAGAPNVALPTPPAVPASAITPGMPDVAETLAARRRAARAAEAATPPNVAPPAPPQPQDTTVAPQVNTQAPMTTDPRWAEIYQRMQRK